MKTHLALLRGINVSGHNIIKMNDLKLMLENIGFSNVQTYIQSGNVFVTSTIENQNEVGFIIQKEIFKTFGHEVPVVVISKKDLEDCLHYNSFLSVSNIDIKKLFVAFLSKPIDSQAINDLKPSQFKPDEIQIYENKIFIKYEIGAGKTKFDQKYIEKKLNLVATIRNWNSINSLFDLYCQIDK